MKKINDKKSAQMRYYNRNKEKLITWHRDYNKTPKRKYNGYKSDAKVRKIEFDLSFEQFIQLWQKPCYYCGSEIITIGIDRINNDIGYIISNIVSSCTTCNYMKRVLTAEIFLEHCQKIVNHSIINKKR